MKTVEEWEKEYRGLGPLAEINSLVRAVRREAFERCELEARRYDVTHPASTEVGSKIAERISKVYWEESK